jgi:hypothetical protein
MQVSESSTCGLDVSFFVPCLAAAKVVEVRIAKRDYLFTIDGTLFKLQEA